MSEHDDVRVNNHRSCYGYQVDFSATTPGTADTVLYESSVFVRRLIRLSPHCEIVCDELPDDGMEIRFLRWTPEGRNVKASLSFAAESSGFDSDERMGTLLTHGLEGEGPVVWLPPGLVVGRMDRYGRLKTVADGEVESWWELDGVPRFRLRLLAAAGVAVYLPMVVIKDGAQLRRSELFQLGKAELQRYVKSDWFDASSPADLWKYYMDGNIYDPRDTGRGRPRCQQCAAAWWTYLMAVHRQTGKNHYRSLARAVAWSVRVDLGPDGSWRHGFWNEEPEIHSRMLWDGVRVLLSEHEFAPHDDLLTGAEAAARFAVENLTEALDGGRLWFLHDSVEGSGSLRVPEPVLGRSENNSLCLNTHIQALCMLARIQRFTGVEQLRDKYQRGLGALEAVLGLPCRGGVLANIDRILPSLLSWKVPRGFTERVLRFITYRVLVGGYWWARKRALCLVFPSGYIDRDLGRTMLADEYHVVNLKDLCELLRLDWRPWLEEVVVAAIRFTKTVDYERALERNPIWAEWADVLELTDVKTDVDFGTVEASIARVLGGRSLDTTCVANGGWRFEEQG